MGLRPDLSTSSEVIGSIFNACAKRREVRVIWLSDVREGCCAVATAFVSWSSIFTITCPLFFSAWPEIIYPGGAVRTFVCVQHITSARHLTTILSLSNTLPPFCHFKPQNFTTILTCWSSGPFLFKLTRSSLACNTYMVLNKTRICAYKSDQIYVLRAIHARIYAWVSGIWVGPSALATIRRRNGHIAASLHSNRMSDPEKPSNLAAISAVEMCWQTMADSMYRHIVPYANLYMLLFISRVFAFRWNRCYRLTALSHLTHPNCITQPPP